jgi:glycosyltransferase involved in cell wall biosynthesis
MRILVVSHSCSTPLNQQIYAEIRRRTGWEFTLVVPENWLDEFGNSLPGQLWSGFDAQLVAAPVYLNGNIILHWYRTSFYRLLLENRFDAIYVNHEPYAVATAQVCWANLRTRRIPFGFYSCQNLEKNYPVPFCWTERMVYRSSAFAFPITNAVGRVIRSKGFAGSMAVCPLPLDPALYRKRPELEREEAISRKSGEVVIGYVGRMVEQKGLRTLVEALTKLPRSGWKLIVIGAGPFEQVFDDLVRERGLTDRVSRLGYVSHEVTPRFLAALDVLVLPSETQPNWKEQFGRVIMEALACGVPVIGSDSGEIPTLIKASGGGRVFPEKNSTALADMLQQMISDQHLRESCADSGYTWTIKNVSLAAVASSMADTIEEVIVGNNHKTNGAKELMTSSAG